MAKVKIRVKNPKGQAKDKSLFEFIRKHAIALGIVSFSLFFFCIYSFYLYLSVKSRQSYSYQTETHSDIEPSNRVVKEAIYEEPDNEEPDIVDEPIEIVDEPIEIVDDTSEVIDDQADVAESTENISTEIVRPNADEIIPIDKALLHEKANDYKDKWVKIAGKITYINDFEENDVIHMAGRSDLRTIYCYLAPDQDISTVKVDEYVTMVGLVDGKILGQLILNDSYIDGRGKESEELELALMEKADQDDKATAIQLTAVQAYKEYTENQVACKTKYEGKYLAITGVIDDIDTNIWGQEYVSFDVGDEWAIEDVDCFFKNDQMDYVATLKKGQKVTIYGICDIGSFDFKLGECHP